MPQKKLLGGAYSPQGALANLRHSRTNERIGHISRPNLWNSNSTNISPKVISTTVALFARFVFRRLRHMTHHLSAHVHHLGHPPHHLLMSCIISCDCSPGFWCPIMLCIS